MCGGKWESVEQQQPAEENKMTERYKRSQKLSEAAKNPSVSSVSQSPTTVTYALLLRSPYIIPLNSSTLTGKILQEQRRSMSARGTSWTHEGTNTLHTQNRHWQSQLSLVCKLTLKQLSPALSIPCLLQLVKLLISIDWLWNLLKFTLPHTDTSVSSSVKSSTKALVQKGKNLSIPSLQFH